MPGNLQYQFVEEIGRASDQPTQQSETQTDPRGITHKYFEAVKNARRRISASDYFGPYLRDLLTILRGRGIELYNEDLTGLSISDAIRLHREIIVLRDALDRRPPTAEAPELSLAKVE